MIQLWELQCVAVCCCVLPCVAVCCSVMQCDAVWFFSHIYMIQLWELPVDEYGDLYLDVAEAYRQVCCSVLQCVAVCCSVL